MRLGPPSDHDHAAALAEIGRLMDGATLAPPPIVREPDAPPSRAPGLPWRAAAMVRALGYTQADIFGPALFAYRDASGNTRILDGDRLDRDTIASLFGGDGWLLSRLFPAAASPGDRGPPWDWERAADGLLVEAHRAGRAALDRPIAETAAAARAHLRLSRLAAKLLRLNFDPGLVLDLALDLGALDAAATHRIVGAACLRQLAREGGTDG